MGQERSDPWASFARWWMSGKPSEAGCHAERGLCGYGRVFAASAPIPLIGVLSACAPYLKLRCLREIIAS